MDRRWGWFNLYFTEIMNTYILFINGVFESAKDFDEFSKNFVENVISVESPKFIIENQYNMIVIFDTEAPDEDVAFNIKEKLKDTSVRFYFLFNRESIMVANIPQEISSLIFKNLPKDSTLEISIFNQDDEEYPNPEELEFVTGELYVDALLEKIEKFGITSLTEKEKKFLDNFKK